MPRLLHFGVGNFHRAHQAYYTHLTNKHGDVRWTIRGVSLRSASVRDQLAKQDNKYTLVIRDGDQTQYETIDAIQDILVAPENPDAVIAAIADPETYVITATVTEKGYHLNATEGRLDLADPDIADDLAGNPKTLLGYLARGLRMRREADADPLTILSCDNLNENGDTLSKALHDFCRHFDPGLLEYLTTHVRFPNCMVDRITPATTREMIDDLSANIDWADACPVETEVFSEWVIEDRFAGPRPDWDRVGVQMVQDVAPYELRKLRLLNGAHSYLAYAGTMAGHTFVHQAIADPTLLKSARALMDEAAETLPVEIREGTADYVGQLIARFSNQSLHHKLRQIAMDGTQKLPVRILATINERRRLGLKSPALSQAIVSWLSFAKSESLAGHRLQDPDAEAIFTICSANKSVVENLLATLKTDVQHIDF